MTKINHSKGGGRGKGGRVCSVQRHIYSISAAERAETIKWTQMKHYPNFMPSLFFFFCKLKVILLNPPFGNKVLLCLTKIIQINLKVNYICIFISNVYISASDLFKNSL